jgi:predicted nucleotide-binding protein
MTEADLRGKLLKSFYERRHNADGWVPTSDIDASGGEYVARAVIGTVCGQLAEAGLIQWKPLVGAQEGFVIGMAKITAAGVDVVAGSKVPSIAVNLAAAPDECGALPADAKKVGEPDKKATVFIGHGNSPLWRELKDFLQDRLRLSVDEFNSVPTAGVPTAERLSEMLGNASFAFLIMTAEDEQADGKVHARPNVVHEVGLFQGRLGFRKAIILIEVGCEEFSNIRGLGQIRFPNGAISAKFDEIRSVLEREGLVVAPK